MIAVVGALEIELSAFIDAMKILEKCKWGSRFIYKGLLFGEECVVTYSGVGKVFAALTLQHIIDEYKPEVVFFVGIAGSLDISLKPGDVVIAEETLQYDFDLSAFGFEAGEIPLPQNRSSGVGGVRSIRKIKCSGEYITSAKSWIYPGCQVVTGLVVTGDNFIDFNFLKENGYIRKRLDSCNAAALEMEGASAAQVCYENQVSFLLLRVISDAPWKEEGRVRHFNKFVKKSSEKLYLLVLHALKKRKPSD